MFIVWGKKRVHRSMGHVADYCPMCRGPRTFSMRRIGLAGHLYYVSVSEGELVGYDRTCADCGTCFNADLDHYETIAKRRGTLEALAASTFPRLKEAWADRLALDVQIRTAASLMPAAQRAGLVREPFALLSPQVEARYASTHLDMEVGVSMLGAFALCVLLPRLVVTVYPDDGGPAILTALVVGVLLVLWQLTQVNRRYLGRKVVPVLARALEPLRPSEAELAAALGELAGHGHKIGKKLKASDVFAQLGAAPAAVVSGLAGER